MNKVWFPDYEEQIFSNNAKEAKRVLLDNIDKTQMIYKYCRGLSRDLENIRNEKLWLSSAFGFNDPYDCLMTVDCGLKIKYPQSQKREAMQTYLRQESENRKSELLRSSIFVSCFSEINNSFPMWGYYAAEHKGMCLGYNLYDLIERYDCMPVIYSDKLRYYDVSDSERNFLQSTLTKSSEWSHEKEWRIVIKKPSKEGKNGILENFTKPKEIFIGCRHREIENYAYRIYHNEAEDEMYIELEDLLEYAENEEVEVSMPMISRKDYKLLERAVILNRI